MRAYTRRIKPLAIRAAVMELARQRAARQKWAQGVLAAPLCAPGTFGSSIPPSGMDEQTVDVAGPLAGDVLARDPPLHVVDDFAALLELEDLLLVLVLQQGLSEGLADVD